MFRIFAHNILGLLLQNPIRLLFRNIYSSYYKIQSESDSTFFCKTSGFFLKYLVRFKIVVLQVFGFLVQNFFRFNNIVGNVLHLVVKNLVKSTFSSQSFEVFVKKRHRFDIVACNLLGLLPQNSIGFNIFVCKVVDCY